jgi:aryl-alcohol dehydrogenase-like predicted oxidoreductase
MNTDHLDLVQLHASPSKQVMEENGVVETLRMLQREGKVRFIGMSGTIPNLADQIAMGVFDAFQIPYSLLEPEHDALISQAAAAGAGVIIRGGIAKGEGSAEKSEGDRWSLWQKAGLDELLDEGMTVPEFVLRYTLSHPGMHTTIVGTLNLDHLQHNVDAYQAGPLPADVYAEAKRRVELARKP